jgi:tetratricopeptide (TPR) repeat protein
VNEAMRRKFAEWLNEFGNRSRGARAAYFYRLATRVDSQWGAPWYNLGLQAKYSGNWLESLKLNQRAVQVSPEDEAAWWNLGIAATALRNWPEARRAWKAYGINLDEGVGETFWEPASACARLDPIGSGEVVWGDRIDPARLVIQNVPLPESKHRYRDIVLIDGAQNGARLRDGIEVPVFDELALWSCSSFSTFRAKIFFPGNESRLRLAELCSERNMGFEDWSEIDTLCAKCSHETIDYHGYTLISQNGELRTVAFAAQQRHEIELVLEEWKGSTSTARVEELELIFAADNPKTENSVCR